MVEIITKSFFSDLLVEVDIVQILWFLLPGTKCLCFLNFGV